MMIAEANIDTLKRVAQIIPGSAAAKAIAEFNQRKAAGEDVRIYESETRAGKTLLVGPPLNDGAQ